MNKDITTLARALLAGDLTAVIPLIDELKVNDDWREAPLHEAVGTYLREAESLFRHRSFVNTITCLFWREREDRDAALKASAGLYASRIQSPPQEEAYDTTTLVSIPPPGTVTTVHSPWPTPGGVLIPPGLRAVQFRDMAGRPQLAIGSVLPEGVVEAFDYENRLVLVRPFPAGAATPSLPIDNWADEDAET